MTTISAMPVLDQATLNASSSDTYAILSDDSAPLNCFLLSTPSPLANELDCPFNDELIAWKALVRVRAEHPNGMAWAIDTTSGKKGAQVLYSALADIPVNDDDEIEQAFLHFDAGTPNTVIWHWFESYFDISIAELAGC